MPRTATAMAALLLTIAQPAIAQSIKGDAAAIAAAEKLLDHVGGRAAWARRVLEVEETGYLRNGEVAKIRIWRDFENGAMRLERTTPTVAYAEWTGPDGGWSARNGAVTLLSPEEHAVERQGLKQEPYAIYHRLARRDPALRVQLRDDGRTLTVYDRDDRVLCWFNLDGQGSPLGWGNHYDGNLNQHYYGPIVDMGDVNLPKFGASSIGVFRFEYVSGRMSDGSLAEPAKPAPKP